MENKIISPCISICRTDPVTGYWRGHRSSITGTEVEYGMEIRGINAAGMSTTRPNKGDGGGNAGSASGSATEGVVIVRVPKDKVTATGGWV